MSLDEAICNGRGNSASDCSCVCHLDPAAECDAMFCLPISARASDNIRYRHVNRDPDTGKKATRRGTRSLRKG